MKVIFHFLYVILFFHIGTNGITKESKFLIEIEKVNEEKKHFLREMSDREDACLKKFFSGSCLERLDIDYETGIRDFDSRTQQILRKRREHRAESRRNRRQKKMDDTGEINLQ